MAMLDMLESARNRGVWPRKRNVPSWKLFRQNSVSRRIRTARPEIRQELNHIDGLIVMNGGIKIVSAGYNPGAVGVSGAPDGEKDAACAGKALEKLDERIEFAIE